MEEWWGPITSESESPDLRSRSEMGRLSSADTIYCTPTPVPTSDHTWLERLIMEVRMIDQNELQASHNVYNTYLCLIT